jgi:hypothetical protein
MFAGIHRGGCCGINELRSVAKRDLAKGGLYDTWPRTYSWRHNIQYRAHCPHDKREWMEPELIAAGFVLLATNASETVWGMVGKN